MLELIKGITYITALITVGWLTLLLSENATGKIIEDENELGYWWEKDTN